MNENVVTWESLTEDQQDVMVMAAKRPFFAFAFAEFCACEQLVKKGLMVESDSDYSLTPAGGALLPGASAGDVSGDDKYYLKETTDSDWREVSMEEFTRAEVVNGQVTYKASDTALYAWVGKNDMRGKIEPATKSAPTTDGKLGALFSVALIDADTPRLGAQIVTEVDPEVEAAWEKRVADYDASVKANTCKRCNTEPAVAAGLCAGCVGARLEALEKRVETADALLSPFGYAWRCWNGEPDKRQGFNGWYHQWLDEHPSQSEEKFQAVDEYIRTMFRDRVGLE